MIRKLGDEDEPGQLTRSGLQQLIALAIACLADRQFNPLLATIEGFLQKLPWPADETDRWRIHLRNAHRYQLANELGAARFELRLLQQFCIEVQET